MNSFTANTNGPADVIQVRFKATTAQVDMMQDGSPIKVWVCGRRWGKTTAMKMALASTAIMYPGSVSWFVSNTYAKSLGEMRKMSRSEGFMRFVRRAYTQFPPRYDMKNGSEIAFRSLDGSDNLRGEGLKLIAHDEAAYSPERAFKEVLLPMIADTDGTYILGSTYNGKNWFYETAMDGINGLKPGMRTWVFPTRTGIQFQGERGKTRLEMLRQQYLPSVWAQEYECEPLVIQNAAFRFVEGILVDYAPPSMPDPTKKYIAGIDIGRQVDPPAVVVLEVETGLIVYAQEYPLEVEHTVTANQIRGVCEYWHAQPVIDSTQPGNRERWVEIYKDILRGCRCVGQNKAVKYNMITNLGHDIEMKRLQIPKAWKGLIDQIYDFQFRIPEGMALPIYYHTPGKHDDLLSALYIAVWARKKGWEPDTPRRFAPVPATGSQGRILYDARHKKDKNKGKL